MHKLSQCARYAILAFVIAAIASIAAPLPAFADPLPAIAVDENAPEVAQAAQAVTGSTISGTVKDDAGRPIPGVRVSLNGPTRASATTGGDGTFSFTGLKSGTYLVTAERTAYATINTTISLAEGASQTATFTLENANQTTLREIGRVVTSRNRSTELNTTPAATNTITSQTYIERGQPQISNLLEELPGVELQRFSSGGSPGANTVAALRGADPSETQTLIDGHPVSGGPQGDYLLQFLNPLLLSDVEVTKGPGTQSDQIQNQVNGSINYRTLPITKQFTARLTGGYDTFDGSTASLFASDTIGKFGFLAGYARYGTPGYFTGNILSVIANGTPLPGTIPDATATIDIPSSQTFNNQSELFKLGYDFSNSTAITLSYLGLHTYADYTSSLTTQEPFHIVASCPAVGSNAPSGPGTGAGCGAFGGSSGGTSYTNPIFAGLVGKTVFASSTNDNLYLGNFETDNEPFFTGELRTTFGPGSFLGRYYAASIARDINGPAQVNQPYQCDDPTCNPAIINKNNDFEGAFYQTQTDYLHGADFAYQLPIGPNTYTASYDTHGDRTSACSGGEPNPSGTNCSVPSILQTSETIAARGDFHFGNKFAAQLGNYFSHTTFVGSRYDPHGGITFQPNANAIVRLAAGSSFVAPSAQTAYDITPHVERRTTLYRTIGGVAPETDVSYNVGTDLRTGSDSKLSVDLYATRLFNRFNSTTITGTGAEGSFEGQKYTKINETFNQATALEEGIELTYVKAPQYGFGTTDYLNFLHSYAGGSNSSFFPPQGSIYGNVADGQQFIGYPYTHGRVELNYLTKNAIRAAFGADYYGALNSFNQPGFVLFDADTQIQLKNQFVLGFSVQNVFNHDDYRTYGTYNYGTSAPALGGGIAYSSLFFAPPRQFTFQLSRSVGNVGGPVAIPLTPSGKVAPPPSQ